MIISFTHQTTLWQLSPSSFSHSGDGLYNPKYMKGQHKESKEARRARNKVAKKNKFDPNARETTLQTKIRFENEEYDDDNDDEYDDDNDDNDDDDNQIEDNHEEEDDEMVDSSTTTSNRGSDKSPTPTTNSITTAIVHSPHQSRIEALRAKLRAKLEEKRSNRPVLAGDTSDTMISKRAARRAEKNRKIELAKKKQQQQQVSSGSTQTGKNKKEKISLVKQQDLGGSQINERSNNKSVVDDLSCIDFGKIAGLKNDLSGNYSEANKSLKNTGKKKSLEKLLAEAEAKKERLRQLKESDDVEDKEKAKNIAWGDTLKIAR